MISRRAFLAAGSTVLGGLAVTPLAGLAYAGRPDVTDTDVLIIGAGPAGMVLARRLAEVGMNVTLIESGGAGFDPRSQALAEVLPVGSSLPSDVGGASIRAIGGSTNVWGGICPRLQPCDFVGASSYGYGVDWPLSYRDLEPYYCHAEHFLRVGAGSTPVCKGRLQAAYLSSSHKLAGLLQSRVGIGAVSPASMCVDSEGNYVPLVLSGWHVSHPCIRLLRATAIRVELGASGHARGVVAIGADGHQRFLTAWRTVLAAGAVQNARLLMLSAEQRHPDGLGNAGDALGRWFMEHPSLRFWVKPKKGYAGRFSTSAYSHVLHWYELMKKDGLGSVIMRVGIHQQLYGYARGRTQPDHLWMFEATCEQEPQPGNQLSLHASREDVLRQRLPTLRFSQTERDLETIARGRRHLLRLLEPFADNVIEQPLDTGSHHLMGVTRMSAKPESGVVDTDLQVHGVPGLYVVGASVFPTGGAANPTLTLTALALRLGRHLIERRNA